MTVHIKTINVLKRSGKMVPYNEEHIAIAMSKAFAAEMDRKSPDQIPSYLKEEIKALCKKITNKLIEQNTQSISVEEIQDMVETQLMHSSHPKVAKRYILYRDSHSRLRSQSSEESIGIWISDGKHRRSMNAFQLESFLTDIAPDLTDQVNMKLVAEESIRSLYSGASKQELHTSLILSARAHIEKDPAYMQLSARLLLEQVYEEILLAESSDPHFEHIYRGGFIQFIKKAIGYELLDSRLIGFDLQELSKSLVIERDQNLSYLGLQTLYDRYFLHNEDLRLETPQFFWMRVAMGLAINEDLPTERALEFYHLLSKKDFMSSTPTLFNSGTRHPQLSSCYLTTINDNLEHIFKCVGDNARLSKWAGGIGNDWTNVRAAGAHIKGTNGQTQGIVPFLKVANDTLFAVNQGGKRKGVGCAYLETWHLDIEEFLELRKNSGDERRRTHDMNTANWIPDLFMKRVEANASWTLFNPCETPDLHETYGEEFETLYEKYESMAAEGRLKQSRRVEARDLWKKMITMLFETGHPWITFKDPSNIRSAQSHCGIIHSSNLCTEIFLNTSEQETAVCNLGSINLAQHIHNGKLNKQKVANTIKTAMRMLDNVIDINFYPTKEAESSNLNHRPVGLGIMGFQDALYQMNTPYSSEEAIQFADTSTEIISYYAIQSSSLLAEERGKYSSYENSTWDRGLLPIDTLELLEASRGDSLEVNKDQTMDWQEIRDLVQKHGMRNCQVMAIAPTATIANIVDVVPCIEPTFSHLFAKSNLSGEFTVVNKYLVSSLKERGLWTPDLISEIKYWDGCIANIKEIPGDIKKQFQSSFEIEPKYLIESASRRQKWVDMGQSLNLYISEPDGKKISDTYFLAWKKGLKSTYYLRTLGATQVEKSTLDLNNHGIQPRWMKHTSASSQIQITRCQIDDESCESCQ